MKTRVNELLGITYPIIQGGMAWVAEHHLAGAVSAAGGLGLIGAASAPAEWVRSEIRKVREMTDRPFGVNADEPLCCGSGTGSRRRKGSCRDDRSGKSRAFYADVEGSRCKSDSRYRIGISGEAYGTAGS